MAKSAVVLILLFFTLQSIFPHVDLAELSRIPELWSHFQMHRKERGQITLLEFLNMHYNDPQHTNASPLDHQKLPFSKTHNHRVPAFQIVLSFANVNFQTAYTCLGEIEGVDYYESRPNKLASSIWQPPKI